MSLILADIESDKIQVQWWWQMMKMKVQLLFRADVYWDDETFNINFISTDMMHVFMINLFIN